MLRGGYTAEILVRVHGTNPRDTFYPRIPRDESRSFLSFRPAAFSELLHADVTLREVGTTYKGISSPRASLSGFSASRLPRLGVFAADGI